MIVSQMMKEISCTQYKQDCDKCNLYYGCDRVKVNMINVGDYIETPRFLKVKIADVYTDNSEALQDGYTEPTHYRSVEYHVRGKHTGKNTMIFAAIKR